MGTLLSYHNHVTYLNERRDLWSLAYPITDIWGQGSRECGGKLLLTAADEYPKMSVTLRRLFKWQTLRTGRPFLIEKLSINSFRVEFLDCVFPKVRFIHIRRDGLEVAERSVADRLFEITYDELINNPDHSVGGILRFLELPTDSSVNEFAALHLVRRYPKLLRPLSKVEELLAGPYISEWTKPERNVLLNSICDTI